ncbi:MAG: hypothetical protein OXU81_13710 [Gammaproteobacteria bacterium]|nr:hypothetical protein [Gammaproteobacteria bacterium]
MEPGQLGAQAGAQAKAGRGRDDGAFETTARTFVDRLHTDVAMILEVDYMWQTIGHEPTTLVVQRRAFRFGNVLCWILRDHFMVTIGRLFDRSRDSISVPIR